MTNTWIFDGIWHLEVDLFCDLKGTHTTRTPPFRLSHPYTDISPGFDSSVFRMFLGCLGEGKESHILNRNISEKKHTVPDCLGMCFNITDSNCCRKKKSTFDPFAVLREASTGFPSCFSNGMGKNNWTLEAINQRVWNQKHVIDGNLVFCYVILVFFGM